MRKTEHASIGEYLRWLETLRGAGSDDEWQEFINCLTTNLTNFFREEHHFHALTEWLQQRGNQATRIWCAAASTGEEPYSLAITCAESLGLHANVKILATDIDTNVQDRILVGSTIEMAHSLGRRVVAEGVETTAVLQTLSDLGCDSAQGYLIGRPMTLDALLGTLAPNRQASARQN